MIYRKEIDGLRALAVISVVLFHAGFSSLSGGFLGVDVFFVISGYLITSILNSEIKAGKFSLWKFYESRARRILPALFVVLLGTLPIAWFWMLPQELKEYLLSVSAVILMSSNVFFWWISDYFNSATEIKPLLHTWSLSVEEQFYLFFPFLMLGLRRLSKKGVILVLVFILVCSFAAAQAGGNFNFKAPYLENNWSWWNHPRWAFYFSISRAWELALGGLVAFMTPEEFRLHPFVKGCGSIIGIALVLVAIVTFNKSTPHPSLYTFIPTLGTALIIFCASENTIVGKLLSNWLMVRLGLMSYSVYLWHHPVFAFARIKLIDTNAISVRIILILLVFLLAWMTFVFVERPFRDKKLGSERTLILSLGLTAIAFFVIGVSGHVFNGFEWRLTPEQRDILSYTNDLWIESVKKDPCSIGAQQTSKDFPAVCDRGDKSIALKKLTIWGDSFASALSKGIRKNLDDQRQISQFTASGCLPLINFEIPDRKNCIEVSRFVKTKVEQREPDELLMHADWERLISENMMTIEELEVSVRNTIRIFKQVSPRTKVYVLGNLPLWKPSLPYYIAGLSVAGLSLGDMRFVNRGIGSLIDFDARIEKIVNSENSKFISLIEKLCVKERCTALVQSQGQRIPLVFDYGHLTPEGADYIAKSIISGIIEIKN